MNRGRPVGGRPVGSNPAGSVGSSRTARHRRAAKQYQRSNSQKGLCVVCGKPKQGSVYCEAHRVIHNRRRRDDARKKSLFKNLPKETKCQKCGQKGHNRRTCSMRSG